MEIQTIKIDLLEQGPAAIGKASILEQGSQRKQYLKQPRRESSTTAFKETTTTRGLSYPHKEKRSNGPKYWGQRTKGERPRKRRPYPRSALGSVEDCIKLWCDSKRQPTVQTRRLSQLGFWVTVGIGPQFCIMVRPSGHLFKHVFCIMKGWLGWLGWLGCY